MIRLRATQLHWINGRADDPIDQCAHGRVELVVDGQDLYRTADDADITVSAACLYLLRTLEDDHTPEASVAEHNWMFPCCGFSAHADTGRYGLGIMGCNIGVDVYVRHEGTDVVLTGDTHEARVSEADWASAVLGLVAQVEAFYAACTPKVAIDDAYDCDGWTLFWSEWNTRTHRATQDR